MLPLGVPDGKCNIRFTHLDTRAEIRGRTRGNGWSSDQDRGGVLVRREVQGSLGSPRPLRGPLPVDVEGLRERSPERRTQRPLTLSGREG